MQRLSSIVVPSRRELRHITRSGAFSPADNLALVDGDIGDPQTATKIAETAVGRFGSINALVNNAGIFFTKPFIDYTAEDFRSLVSTNLEGFLYLTQLAIKQMLSQKTGGSIVTITASLADNPIAGATAAVPMITKGGLNAVTYHLAMEYARRHSRERRRARGRGDPSSQKHPRGCHEKAVADGPRFDREGHRRRGAVLDGGPNGDRRGAARRWRGAPRQVVNDLPARGLRNSPTTMEKTYERQSMGRNGGEAKDGPPGHRPRSTRE